MVDTLRYKEWFIVAEKDLKGAEYFLNMMLILE